MSLNTADFFIDSLQLKQHPEGGYYMELYRSSVNTEVPNRQRSLSTSIYFLLKSGEVSKFHQLTSDELWYYHAGSSTIIYFIDNDEIMNEVKLGCRIDLGEQPQVIIKAGFIFGAKVIEPESFTLMGCMVSPGFDFNDFYLFSRNELLEKFPQYNDKIIEFT